MSAPLSVFPAMPATLFGIEFYLCPRCASLFVGDCRALICPECQPAQVLGIVKHCAVPFDEWHRPQILDGAAGFFSAGRWIPFEMRWRAGFKPDGAR